MLAEAAIKPFEVATHNGIVTVTSLESGEHRTLRVRTEHWPQRNQDGSPKVDEKGDVITKAVRVAGLLTGPDNETHYTGFAVVSDDGRVNLYHKYRDSETYGWYRKFLMHPERYTRKVSINFEGRCRRCNKLLTTEESVARGLGSKCAGIE